MTQIKSLTINYTVEMRNRFKGLYSQSASRAMDGGSRHCTGDRDQDHPHGKEMQKGKMVVLRRPYK